MQAEVDPAADFIWDSVGSTTTRTGMVERQPQSDQEWSALRREAIVLVEASNLLALPGRRVAAVDFPSVGAGVLSSPEIQQRLTVSQSEFDAFAQALRLGGRRVLAAIEAHDSAALMREGAALDAVCESCHTAFWYPHQVIPPLPAVPSAVIGAN